MRSALVFLLVTAGLAGCLGGDIDRTVTNVNEHVECHEGEDVSSKSGSLSPIQDLVAQGETPVPSHARIELVTQGAGTIDLVLTNANGTMWEDQFSTTGSGDFNTGIGEVPAGDYTLTASTETGYYPSVGLTLTLTYSQGC